MHLDVTWPGLRSRCAPCPLAQRFRFPHAGLPQVLGVKKVALLFVTGAHMPHDALWRLWLESAAGLLPQQALPSLLDAACGPVLEKWLLLLCACYPKRVTGAVAAVQPPWQYLFSLYVHSPPWGTDGYQGGHLDAVRHCHRSGRRVSSSRAAELMH